MEQERWKMPVEKKSPNGKNGEYYFEIRQAKPVTKNMEPHRHGFLQLFYVLSGSFRHSVNGKVHIHCRNELLILPPFVTHQIDTSCAAGLEWIFVNIGDGFLTRPSDAPDGNLIFDLTCLRPLFYHAANVSPFLRFQGQEAQQLEKILRKLQGEYESNQYTVPFVRSAVSQLFSLITQQYIAAANTRESELITGYRKSLQAAMAYIDAHCTEAITREEVCRIAHMSKSSFTYIFKQLTGLTLLEYVHSQRVHLAKGLLEERQLNFTQVGLRCGFSSLSYFGRVFRKYTGLSPREYVTQFEMKSQE